MAYRYNPFTSNLDDIGTPNPGGLTSVVELTPQAHTAPGTSPVLADASGNINVNGTIVAAHSVPLRSDSLAANTINLEAQYASAVAATDATKVGMAAFDSASFGVDANGFVTSLGGSYHSLAPYIVGTDAFSTYATIQAAINAAHGTGLYSSANQINIYIKPKGAPYNENLTMFDGINLVGFDPNFFLVANAPNNFGVFCGVIIQGKISAPIVDTAQCKLCNLQTQNDSAVLFDFPGVGVSSSIALVGCFVSPGYLGNATTIIGCSGGSGGKIYLDNTVINDFQAGDCGFYTIASLNGGSVQIQVNNSNVQLFHVNTASSGLQIIQGINTVFQIAGFTASGTATVDIDLRGGTSVNLGTYSSSHAGDLAFQTTQVQGTFTLTGNTFGATDCLLRNCTFAGATTPTLIGCTNVAPGSRNVTMPAGNYTLLSTDNFVGADTTAARAITLYAAPWKDMEVVIKDITGTAAANNITVSGNGKNIDGAATNVMTTNYQSLTLVYNGTSWSII